MCLRYLLFLPVVRPRHNNAHFLYRPFQSPVTVITRSEVSPTVFKCLLPGAVQQRISLVTRLIHAATYCKCLWLAGMDE